MVAAGDIVGASPLLSSLFHDEPAIEAMNGIGLDISAVGNHEFDEGASELRRLQRGGCHPVDGCADGTPFRGAKFPFLAANVVSRRTGRTIFPPYVIRKVGGVRIGFIGMTLEGTPELIAPLHRGATCASSTRRTPPTATSACWRRKACGRSSCCCTRAMLGTPPRPADDCPRLRGPLEDIVRRTSREVDVFLTGHTHAAYNCVIDQPAGDQRGLLRAADHAHRPRDRAAARNDIVRAGPTTGSSGRT